MADTRVPEGSGQLDLGWPCPTSDQMREIDRDAIEKRGLPGRVLMENAGRAVAEAVRQRYSTTRRPLVLCGSGNNGGDGFVVARVLRETLPGCVPTLACFGSRERHSPETAANYELVATEGVRCLHAPDLEQIEELLQGADLLIDALFGVGLTRGIEGPLAELVSRLNEVDLPTLAVDVPSGVCATTGRVLGVALHADVTVTIGLPKLGLVVVPTPGSLCVADIGFPRESYRAVPVRATLLDESAIARHLPQRAAHAHKGSFGHCLIVGGSLGKTGAPLLAARGAMRAGAGLVTVAVPETLLGTVAAQSLEAMTLALPDVGCGALAARAASEVEGELASRSVLVIGPGLGTSEETRTAVRAILDAAARPVVVDADALNAIGEELEALRSTYPRVLTPHPGEAARLLGCNVPDLQADRVAAAREIARRSGAHVVLKGARTLVAAPDEGIWINPTGGPGLAAGGSGDVLAGVLGALLAQGLDTPVAASVGVFLHGRSGERRAVGLLAREVADGIPDVWQALLSSRECRRLNGPLVSLF